MALRFTELAAEKMQSCLTQRGRGLGVRVWVVTSHDCDGFIYRLEFVDAMPDHVHVFDSHGAKIFVDPRTLPYVDGSEIRYDAQDSGSGFVIDNPNVREHCGCGDSFYV